jgi:RNA polymerase sigma-70 factor (ECF subfamily)
MQRSLEKKWIEQLAQSDKKAYETIFKAYYQQVFGSALRITKDANIAHDACQEVFLELWKNREKIKITTSLKSYLHRGVMNRSLNIIKSRNRHAGQDLDNVVEPTTKAYTPEQIVEQNELKKHIEDGINGLPERCRQVFVLSRYEGKSYKEIAALMGISVKTVENQMLKALKTLRAVVKKYKASSQ